MVEIDLLRALQQADKVVLVALASSVAERLAVSGVGVEEKSNGWKVFGMHRVVKSNSRLVVWAYLPTLSLQGPMTAGNSQMSLTVSA